MPDKNENAEYNDSYANQVNEIINTLELDSDTDRNILKSRFLSEVVQYEKRKIHTKKYYDRFRFIVTVGSILLPAILSLGQMDPNKLPKNFDQVVYWASWTISLSVTASNGFLQLFSLDKNYFEYALTTEQLKTEGWQYFQLSGKYEDDETHQDAYKDFSKSIENIKRKQVEKEYSGKGDISKKKKEKPFDFQGELLKNLPKQYRPPDIENGSLKVDSKVDTSKVDTSKIDTSKIDELGTLMNDKMNKLDSLMGILENKKSDSIETVENVREILSGSIKEQVGEVAKEAVSSTIDEVVN
jgi:hypothetical protein